MKGLKMENRTLNLIFAVITGKPEIPNETEVVDLDIWKCKSGVSLLTNIFVKNIPVQKDI